MIPAQFDYVAPASVEEALQALAQYGDEAKIIAGGQSLLPVLRMRLNAPELVIDIGKIDSLRGIRDDGDAIVIGAMTTHHDVMHDELVARARAAHHARRRTEVADAQIRHRGTFGGALAHADPAGDLGAPALALGAEFVIAGPGGTRTVAADDFFVDLFETAVGGGRDPHRGTDPQAHRLGSALREVRPGRPPVADRGGGCDGPGPRAAPSPRRGSGLTNMGSTPLRARGVEEALAGATASEDGVRDAAEQGRRRHEPALGPQRLGGVP